MKRFFILFSVLFVLAVSASFAEEATLIDFSKLAADMTIGNHAENKATLIDFSVVAGASVSEEEKAQLKTSLGLKNWEVVLASSARTVTNQSLSYTTEAQVKDAAEGKTRQFAGEKVLGVRVHFPEAPLNSFAMVRPPFEIPFYSDAKTVADDGSMSVAAADKGKGAQFDGYGVVKNVGVLESVSLSILGKNYPHSVTLILKDADGVEKQIFMDYLDFDGWKTLTWKNPNYITEVRNREIRKIPLYPKAAPSLKLVGVVFNRDGANPGGDFITYIKEVKVTFDQAVDPTIGSDVDDEAVWGILQKREEARRNAELDRLGQLQVLRFLEQKKMHISPDTAR